MDSDDKTCGKCKHGNFYDNCKMCEALAQPVQGEPVAWILKTGHGNGLHFGARPPVEGVGWIDVYAHPPAQPPREPLTDADLEYIVSVLDDVLGDIAEWEDVSLAEAVTEAKSRILAAQEKK